MKTNELIDYIQNNEVILLLGAGFSKGSTNQSGDSLPNSNQLAEMLYEKFYNNGGPTKLSQDDLDEAKRNKDNLRKICTMIRADGKVKERDEFIKSVFYGCKPRTGSSLHLLSYHKWKRIYTLNIDDLVENIYDNSKVPLSVITRTSQPINRKDIGNTRLYKLHGSVNSIEDGIVFDDNEYISSITTSDFMQTEFSSDFFTHDIVFLGTEFSEDDLQVAIEAQRLKGADRFYHKCFFVTKKLSNYRLRRLIEDNSDYFFLVEDTVDNFLIGMSKIVSKNDVLTRLYEHKVIQIQRNKLTLSYQNQDSQLYSGSEPTYSDVFSDWDILYPGLESKIESRSKSKSRFISLFGNNYVGKTVIAKRCVVNYIAKGYSALELPIIDHRIYDLVLEYSSSLIGEKKLLVYIENAASYYDTLLSLFTELYNRSIPAVFITVDNKDNHIPKAYHFYTKKYEHALHNTLIFEDVSERISEEYAKNIYDRLFQKSRLGNYLQFYAVNTHEYNDANLMSVKKEILKSGDIVDVLYYALEGQYFKKKFSSILSSLKSDSMFDYLYASHILSILGINSVPTYIYADLVPSKKNIFNMTNFLQLYKAFIYVEGAYIKLSKSRFISSILACDKQSLNREIIYNICIKLANRFKEDDLSENYTLFKKVLRAKRILSSRVLNAKSYIKLLRVLEPMYKNISYYWIQYGIVSQIENHFDDAGAFFKNALLLRPTSFHVNHALAKNDMEKSLHALSQNNTDNSAVDLFNRGHDKMKELLESTDFDHNYRYSLHAYIDLTLKYHNITKSSMSAHACDYIVDRIVGIKKSIVDTEMRNIVQNFVDYAKICHLEKNVKCLYPILSMDVKVKTSKDSYDIAYYE